MPTIRRCPCGRQTYEKDGLERCRMLSEPCEWHRAIAALVWAVRFNPIAGASEDGLDALAFVLREHRRQSAEMNKAIGEEQREAQRAARDSYDQGRYDAERECGRRDW